ncbi:hypothetical protein BDDG_09276, partial [Blastomyces dermatitidis ATCC 18188]
REDKEITELCRLNSAVFQAELRHAAEEELQIKLLRVTVLRIKLFPGFSLNDHMGSYIIMLTEKRGGVAMMMRETETELNMNELISRRDDISLQGIATITTSARNAEEREDMTMKVMLPQLIDITVFTFNLAFLIVMKAAAALQRHLLLTRQCQNKFFIVLQE